MRGWWAFSLGGAVVGLLTSLLLLWLTTGATLWGQRSADNAVNAEVMVTGILLGGLLGITVAYARSTAQIAEQVRQEAEASRRLAEETERTRRANARPLLVLHDMSSPSLPIYANAPDVNVSSDQESVGARWTGAIGNIGTGPALHGHVLMVIGMSPVEAHAGPGGVNKKALPSLGSHHSFIANLYVKLTDSPAEEGYLLLTYQDIYGQKFATKYPLTRGSLVGGTRVEGYYRIGFPQLEEHR